MGGQVISVELATALKQAGLVWHPASGDRFALTTGAFDDEVFTLSDMVVEAQQSRTGTVLGFNGTTEWALDSTESTDEGYLVISVLPGEHAEDGASGYWGTEPAEAYGRALLALIRRATS